MGLPRRVSQNQARPHGTAGPGWPWTLGGPAGGTVVAGWIPGTHSWRRLLVLALLLLVPWRAMPQSTAQLEAAWCAARPGDTPAGVLAAFDRGELHAFDPSSMTRILDPGQAAWVVLRPLPSPLVEERALTIEPPPLTPVTLYRRGEPARRLALDDFDAPVHGHGRLVWRIGADAAPSAPILLRFEADAAGTAPVRFELRPWSDYLRADASWLMFSSACFAVMLAMAAFALCLALMLRDTTFAWYAGYVFCYAAIQGIHTGYVFHPMEWEWLAGTAQLAAPSAALLSLAFAAVFVARFCDLQRFAPVLHAATLALALGAPPLVLMRSSHLDALVAPARALHYPMLLIGAVLLLCAGLVAAVRGSRSARYFLLGFTPLLALTALDSAQTNGALPGMDWLDDAALAAGAVQAIVLSLGLADRALAMRHDTEVVRELADVDALTRVLNRRALGEGLQDAMTCPGEPIALLFLDLDCFKALNDSQGHHAGDAALAAVAAALRHELRPQDLLGRHGGEEFLAVLRGVELPQAIHVATRLCRRVHRLEIPVDGRQQLLTVSIGVSMRRNDDTVDTLVERADHAMYRAKLDGRNRVRVDEKLMCRAHERAAARSLRQES